MLAKAAALTPIAEFPALAGLPACEAGLRATLADGLGVYVVLCDALYHRDGTPYADSQGGDHADNDLRFARLSLAAAEIAARGAGRLAARRCPSQRLADGADRRLSRLARCSTRRR